MSEKGLRVLAFDIGTTGAKTCVFEVGSRLTLLGSAAQQYPLRILPGGGAEQDPADWWRAMCATARHALGNAGLSAESIHAVSFCSQMQGLVLVDHDGSPVRPAMSYMDQRAVKQWKRGIASGLKISGLNARRTVASIIRTGGASASVKDPVWKYRWVRENEPESFKRIYKWLDVKEYLLFKCTGRALMTEDSANATFLFDTRKGRLCWSRRLLTLFEVEPDHMPEVVPCTSVAGTLTHDAASDLGLPDGIPVVGGGGDLTMMALGCGCVGPGDTHIYIGTSGWVSRVLSNRAVDLDHFMGSVLSARPGMYNYIGEQETSGKCLEWVRDHLALDEIGVYPEGRTITDDPESGFKSLLEYMDRVVAETEPGAGGVIFTPWLHGNRSPFEDSCARGMFFNIGLETGKRMLIRAVVEGIVYHTAWLLECIERRTGQVARVRLAGGGALSDTTCTTLADVTGKSVEAMESPQNAGASGAAPPCGIALGTIPDWKTGAELVPVRKVYRPNPSHAAVYGRGLEVYKRLYEANRKNFAALNAGR